MLILFPSSFFSRSNRTPIQTTFSLLSLLLHAVTAIILVSSLPKRSSWVIAKMDGRTFPSRFVPRRFAVLLARRVTGPRRGITRLTQRLERLARNAGNRGDLVRVYQSFPPARERAPSIKTKLSTRVLSPIPDGESSILESKREPKDY